MEQPGTLFLEDRAMFRNSLFILTSLALGFALGSCSVSQEAEYEDEYDLEPPFEKVTVKKDTAGVRVITPQVSEAEKAPRPITLTPGSMYAVQIGAFEIVENADRVEQLAKLRFALPVRKSYDWMTSFYRISVGSFATKDEALEWRKILNERYPGEYRDAWVVEVPR